MKFNAAVLLGLPLFLFGCPDGEPTDTDVTPEPTAVEDTAPTPTPTPEPTTFDVTLADGDGVSDETNGDNDGDTLTLTIANPPEGTWYFGYAQTQSGDAGWYGEACDASADYCHPIPAAVDVDGVMTSTLVLDGVRQISAIVEGSTMLLAVDFPVTGTPDLTYYVGDQAGTGNCYVFGDDPSYYTSLGCMDPGADATFNH